MKFMYIPQVATSSTGFIGLMIDYDPSDLVPANKREFLNARGSVAGPPWGALVHRSDPRDLQKRAPNYVQLLTTGVAENRQAWAGTLYVAVGGQSDASVIGELWVEYAIRLMTPQLNEEASGDLVAGGYGAASYAGAANSAPFGSAVVDGAIPATFESTGTTTSVTTFTFTEPWNGYVALDVFGADLGVTYSGTADLAAIFHFDDNTRLSSFESIEAEAGETFIVTIANTTFTSLEAIFVRGTVLASTV
jgi:hypothetical protein